MEDVHLLFCAVLIYIFSYFLDVELRNFLRPQPIELRLFFSSVPACVICNTYSFHSVCTKLAFQYIVKPNGSLC